MLRRGGTRDFADAGTPTAGNDADDLLSAGTRPRKKAAAPRPDATDADAILAAGSRPRKKKMYPRAPKATPIEPYRKQKFYQLAVTILHLLNKISPKSDWKLKLSNLMEEYSTIPFQKMGFDKDWQNDQFWKL